MEISFNSRLFEDPRLAAVHAGLHYFSDAFPGITRRPRGKGFCYRGPDGKAIADPATLARIRTLAIPPAWTDVWIAPRLEAHLAATGRDAKGRKQYRYNPEFVRVRDAAKFEHLITFAEQLPKLRRQVFVHMAVTNLTREKVLATIVHLLESTNSRVGNESYAKHNESYGLTTLRNRHVQVHGNELKFLFKGKSGKLWSIRVESRRVAKVIRACQELPGQNLFEYRDEAGEVRGVSSGDVNAYLREIAGREITAKDFRTWSGTLVAATSLFQSLARGEPPNRAGLRDGLGKAAECLGNTVTICRKCYVHPSVVSAYEAGTLDLKVKNPSKAPGGRFALSPAERAVLSFLKKSAKP